MSVRLDDTTAAQVGTAISAERFRQGSSAVGRVLTLVIVADEGIQADSVRAAAEAAREHPCRILAAIPRPGRGPARLDAEITVGGNDGLGELAELRLRGPLSHHIASVVLPLLVPDAPVVVWWPGQAPDVPSQDPVGRLAQRRITDTFAASRPLKALQDRAAGYSAGDTDLAWTRITPWRALVASALDQPFEPITAGSVHVQRGNPSGILLAAWLQHYLGVPVGVHTSRGPGITAVSLHSTRGDITVSRPDGRVARLSRPGFPDREAALQRRTTEGLIAEELRRLDPDDIYGEVLGALSALGTTTKPATTKPPTKAAPKPATKSASTSATTPAKSAKAAAKSAKAAPTTATPRAKAGQRAGGSARATTPSRSVSPRRSGEGT
jgi:glucose-6-phosphate dehydrogenase assembly protein OpcA